MVAPPKWAQDLTLETLLWWGSKGHKAPNFNLIWRKRAGIETTGTSYHDKIVVNVGSGWEVYLWAKLPIGYCKMIEGEYKKRSLVAYDKFYNKERGKK